MNEQITKLENEIKRKEKRLVNWTEEFGKDNVLVLSTKYDLEDLNKELRLEKYISHFPSNIRKAIKLMKVLEDEWLDEKVPDPKKARKVKHLINKEVINLKLKIKELTDKLSEIEGMQSTTQYDEPSSWFRYIEREMKDG